MKLLHSVSLLSLLILLLLLSGMAVAAPEPPTLENHQFYGKVHWDADQTGPEEVVAVAGEKQFTSAVIVDYCGENTCSGSFGYGAGNTLRVTGKQGDVVTFFVENKAVTTHPYIAWEVTELPDFNFASNPVDKPACEPDWNCGIFSECTDGTQTRTCVDENKCDPNTPTKIEPQLCNGADVSAITCEQEWQCGGWSACISGEKARSCTRVDDCDAQSTAGENVLVVEYPRPAETQLCLADVTFQAITAPPPAKEITGVVEEQAGLSLLVYVGGFLVFIALVIIIYLIFRRKQTTV